MYNSCGTDTRLSVVAIVSVVDQPMILHQIGDSFHSLALSGLCEAPVTLKHYCTWARWCLHKQFDQTPSCPSF